MWSTTSSMVGTSFLKVYFGKKLLYRTWSVRIAKIESAQKTELASVSSRRPRFHLPRPANGQAHLSILPARFLIAALIRAAQAATPRVLVLQ